MPPLVEAKAVTRRFGGLVAVSELDLSVESGEVFGLLGPNGAGKTTTVRMIGATLRPSGGKVLVAGHDTAIEPDSVKRSIGYMAQKFSLYGDLTVRENLGFFAALYGLHGGRARKAVARALELTELTELKGRIAGHLSGGQKQLLALAVAIVHGPKLIVLDEPTAGLDPIHRQQIWDLLYQLMSDGATVLVTTHGMDEAERCQRLGFINRGRLLAVGTPHELKERLEGRLVVARCREISREASRLRELPEVAWAHPHQGLLRICLIDKDVDQGPVRDALAGDEIELKPVVANLEDVFYDLSTRVPTPEAEEAA